MLQSVLERGEASAVLVRTAVLWLQEDLSCQELALQKCLPKEWAAETHFPLFTLESEGGQMIPCLEFQECFSPDFCPPVLGIPLLVSELTGVGLNSILFFFSPALLFIIS